MLLRHTVRLLLLRGLARAIPSCAQAPTEPPRRILVIRPDHLGDALFTTPALRALRTARPAAEITMLAGPWTRETFEHCPQVDRIVTVSFPWFDRAPRRMPWAPYRLLWKTATALKSESFDLAFVLRFDHWWGALLAALVGIPERVGYDTPETRPFLTHPVCYTSGRHEVEQNLGLIQSYIGDAGDGSAGDLEFVVSPEERAFADTWTAGLPAPWIALHPGSGAPVKRWRSAGFARVADSLAAQTGAQVILTGSPAETDLVREVQGRMRSPARPLIGATLGQLAAVLARCRLAIGPDSGVLHLAAAVGTPTVRLYGPVDAHTFGPWGSREGHRVVVADIPCIPCNRLDFDGDALLEHPCIRIIPAASVLDQARAVLEG